MDSTIMDYQLNIRSIFWRVEKIHADKEIVSRTHQGKIKYTYKEFAERVRKLTTFLENKGLGGKPIASIAWNTHRHLELYFAVPMLGGVLHTVNVRFHPNEMEYVITQMGDSAVFLDEDVLDIFKESKLNLQHYLLNQDYDREVNSQLPIKDFPDVDEKSGAVSCFTSGTTGRPKGVIYSHRSIFVHSLSLLSADVLGISSSDSVMVVVPMFHISGWDVPFSALMTGSKLVLPGPRPKAEDLLQLIQEEKVSIAIGAPTVWIDFINYVNKIKADISSLKSVVMGGSEPPKGLIKSFVDMGIKVYHAWGMTETEAIATINKENDIDKVTRQGYPIPGFEIDLRDPLGDRLPWDEKTIGELVVRGAFVTAKYLGQESKNSWLRTGDVAIINSKGSVKVVDRIKDLIKSGGEWISTVDLENAIMSHPKVLEAVVVGVRDEKWGERPVALVVPKEKVSEDEIRDYLLSLNAFPKWWIPEKIIFVDSIPKTSTGKLDKKNVRDTVAKLIH
ncbi:AMP-dependent synthetase [Candidatus Acidianus copahuensis]|uniref:AMP-dependent synthetase n=1 Tax=Candidatus Acidianus copahuensis TaxID=1160895 RepID=A0A031LQJ9_9CREN|nr:long-chain-fatty-acid--CoA ligase [Candidatus Acidianus copahuensis]EZQ06704.1 AMP-dependent synthetase [Candidatus Acidianus copahuensis]